MILKTNTRGFTLIELLVVIAIIGILASVVLASLNSARSKGEDASAVSSMNQVRAGAEIAYDTKNGNYTGVCPTITNGDPGAAGTNAAEFGAAADNARNAINAAAGAAGDTAGVTIGFVTCNSDANSYAISIRLNTGHYCVDSTGFAGKRATAGILGTGPYTCPAS